MDCRIQTEPVVALATAPSPLAHWFARVKQTRKASRLSYL